MSAAWKVAPTHFTQILTEFVIGQAKLSYIVQLLAQPSPEKRLVSSHSSPLLTNPSPQAKIQKLLTIMYPISQVSHTTALLEFLLHVVQCGPIATVHNLQVFTINTYPTLQLKHELVPPPLQVRHKELQVKAV